MKNVFTGRFDEKILIFPEVCSKSEIEDLEAFANPLEKYFTSIDTKSIDRNSKIPDDVMAQLKEFGLFGLQVPQDYGGLGLSATEYARVCEVTSLDGSIGVTLAAHQAIGLKGILQVGTDRQKEKYLPRLARGEHVAAFCLTEPSSGSDAASIQTRAKLSGDGKAYILNGEKIWITNGGIADVFTVFAKTEVTNAEGVTEDKMTAFIVERAFGGVTSSPPEDKLGIRGSNTCAVHFDNTPVPVENVLGAVGDGFKVAMNILNSGRFSMGSSSAGSLKKLVQSTMQHAITRQQFGKRLSEFEIIKGKFSKMAVIIYAMESMAYLTAGIIDSYQQPDASVESALVKLYSSQGAWHCVSECLQILGGLGYMKAYPYEQLLRDARILMIFEGTNEILQLFVALTCLQYAGKALRNDVRKLRDPLNNLGFLFRTVREATQARKDPKLTLKLNEHVHPLLQISAMDLEKCVHRLRLTTRGVLGLYTDQIVGKQLLLARLADVAVTLYGMVAVLARASRSLSIGLPNNEYEATLAQTFCFEGERRIHGLLEELSVGLDRKAENSDELHRRIADHMIKSGGCFAAHPLARNW